MITELITKIAVAFFAAMFFTGVVLVCATPLIAAVASPVTSLAVLALAQLLALLAGAGWYCAESDLIMIQMRHNSR